LLAEVGTFDGRRSYGFGGEGVSKIFEFDEELTEGVLFRTSWISWSLGTG
jgi:hypothetical protein